jgi:uncharacterized protein YdeI (YjbR/CyaY-like superfamily)
MKPLFFPTAADFRRWLAANGHTNAELVVGFYKRTCGKPSITWPESVDEALCFGWIDGVRHSLNAECYTIRFTPRKAKSQWSAVNIKRVAELKRSGRMTAAGMKAFEGATDQPRKYAYEQRQAAAFDAKSERRFRANKPAWDYFQSKPPWYRRIATFWVISAKKEETRERRLATLIDDSANSRPIKGLSRPVPKWQPNRKKDR